jgi:hypothetical protein
MAKDCSPRVGYNHMMRGTLGDYDLSRVAHAWNLASSMRVLECPPTHSKTLRGSLTTRKQVLPSGRGRGRTVLYTS